MFILIKIIAIINLALCVYLAFLKNRQGSPVQFFYLTLMGIFLYPNLFQKVDHTIDFHPLGNIFYFSTSDYIAVNLLAFAYLLIFILIETVLKSAHVSFQLDQTAAVKNINLSIYMLPFVFFCAYFLWLINTYGFTVLGTTAFLDLRSGAIGRHYLLMSYLGILSAFLPAYLFHQKNNKIAALATLIILSAFFGILGGSRQIFVVACFALIAPFVNRRSRSVVIWVLLFTIGFPLLENSLAFVKALRNAGSIETRIDLIMQMISGTDVLRNTSLDGNISHVFNMFVSTNSPPEFGQGKYLVRSLLFWLPSFLDVFNIKPDDFEAVMFSFAMGGHEGTMHATYFGSTYADLMYFFPLWCIYTSVVFKIIEYRIRRSANPYFLYCIGIYVSIMSARGALYAVLVVLFLAVIFDGLCRLLPSRSRHTKPPKKAVIR